jgi:hypothetical protein
MLACGLSAGLPAAAGGTPSCDPGTSQPACDASAMADISGGPLGIAGPTSLSWTDTLNGYNQSVADTDTSDQSYTVTDPTGTGAGWNVTVEATPFTGTNTGAVLPDSTVLETNGDPGSESGTSAPTAQCATDSTCTLPTPSGAVAYPAQIPVSADDTAQPVAIYDASSDSGMGSAVISDVGWWLNIPANTEADTYSSTIVLTVNSGPAP